MDQIDTDGAPTLRSFVSGLRNDLDAVTAGLILTHNSGPVEGAVNRIKMIKRQMFGRAGFDLLRERVLLATRLLRSTEFTESEPEPNYVIANPQPGEIS